MANISWPWSNFFFQFCSYALCGWQSGAMYTVDQIVCCCVLTNKFRSLTERNWIYGIRFSPDLCKIPQEIFPEHEKPTGLPAKLANIVQRHIQPHIPSTPVCLACCDSTQEGEREKKIMSTGTFHAISKSSSTYTISSHTLKFVLPFTLDALQDGIHWTNRVQMLRGLTNFETAMQTWTIEQRGRSLCTGVPLSKSFIHFIQQELLNASFSFSSSSSPFSAHQHHHRLLQEPRFFPPYLSFSSSAHSELPWKQWLSRLKGREQSCRSNFMRVSPDSNTYYGRQRPSMKTSLSSVGRRQGHNHARLT